MSFNTSRFTDLNKEAVTQIPTPIYGYENESVESLEESVQPIAHLFQGIEKYAWIAKQNSEEGKEDLTKDESASIRLYTMSFPGDLSLYKILNKTLRDENRENLKIWFKYLKLFLTGLEKLPSINGTVWRGIRDVDLTGQYPKGKIGAWWGISSCTSTLDILESNTFLGKKGNRTLFSIECQHGKSIKQHSRYASEDEIILMPGFHFQVTSQFSPVEGLTIIHLKQIEVSFSAISPRPLPDLHHVVIGEKYVYEITGRSDGSVWGANIYKNGSDIATAAVHAGIIQVGQTKIIQIKIHPGQSNYQGNIQNGITSLSSSSSSKTSYYFISNTNDNENPPIVAPINLETYRSKIGQNFSFIVTGYIGGSVWGTDIYTDDSNIAAASVHAGIISIGQTKSIDVKILPGELNYIGSTRNGVMSSPYANWVASYSFIANENIPDTMINLSNNLTDFPIFTGQSSMSVLYSHNIPNPFGPMCGSIDDNDYVLMFYTIPVTLLILYKGKRCMSITAINMVVADICWSQLTQSFIIASSNLYEFNPLTGILSEPYVNNEVNQTSWTIASNLNYLFVVYYPNMLLCRRDINKPFDKKEEWLSKDIMREHGDQLIGSIRINEKEQILALTIKQIDNRWRADLFRIVDMQRLRRGESFGFPAIPNKFYCMIIPLINNYKQWLVVNDTTGSKSQIILLDENGRTINEINSNVMNITLVGKDKIAYLTKIGITICSRIN